MDKDHKDMIELAKSIATQAHQGKVDKGGHPYIGHPMAVAGMVETDEQKTVAWLHDVVEDTDMTLDDLRARFPDRIVDAVDAVTRRPDENRQDYLNRVAANEIATVVKIADLKHNSDLSRISRPLTEKDYARVERYAREMLFLMEK